MVERPGNKSSFKNLQGWGWHSMPLSPFTLRYLYQVRSYTVRFAEVPENLKQASIDYLLLYFIRQIKDRNFVFICDAENTRILNNGCNYNQ